MTTCPPCGHHRNHVKDGLTRAGSQRLWCRACGKRYTFQAKVHGYAPAVGTQAVKLYVDGMTFRRIARQ